MQDEADFQARTFDYVPHPDQRAATPMRRPVAIVGAGPVGLALVPGRGPALKGEAQVAEGLRSTAGFIADVRASVEAGVAAGKDLNAVYKETFAKLKPKYGHWVIFDHCMPFDVTRCFDEMTQYADPRVWTAERDRQMWETLEG